MELIDRIGLKLSEQPLTLEDIMAMVNQGSGNYSRGEVRVELNHLLSSQMVTAKIVYGKDLYSLTRLGVEWADGARK